MQGQKATMRHGARKKRIKHLKHTGIFFRNNLQLKGVC